MIVTKLTSKPVTPLRSSEGGGCYAELNGVDQYWQLSESITIPSNAEYYISAMVQPEDFDNDIPKTIFSSASNGATFWVYLNKDNTNVLTIRLYDSLFLGFTFTDDIGGVITIGADATGITVTNNNQSLFRSTAIALNGFNIQYLGYRGLYGYLKGSISDFSLKVGGVETNHIPLTNKAQGATQLPTIGSVSATMVNYNESVWNC